MKTFVYTGQWQILCFIDEALIQSDSGLSECLESFLIPLLFKVTNMLEKYTDSSFVATIFNMASIIVAY